MNNITCDICGQSSWSKKYNNLIECNICGLVRAAINPSQAELNKYYSQDYYFGEEYFDYIQDRKAIERNFQKRIDVLNKYFNKKSNCIEIGCAYGYFLNLMNNKVASIEGYDVSEDAIKYASKTLKMKAYNKDFIGVNKKDIDAVFMWDVIEHLRNPDEYIEKISKTLKKSGRLILTTGDVGSMMAKKRGGKWRMIHPPTHLFYFSEDSITKLLRKHDLEVVSISHPGVYRNIDSVFNQLLLNKKTSKKSPVLVKAGYSAAKLSRLNKVDLKVNTFDIMEVVAVKK